MAYFVISKHEPETDNIQVKNETEELFLSKATNFEHKEGNRYEEIDASGKLQSDGVIVLNNIPVSEAGKQTFEQRFLNRARAVEDTSGFTALKVLRPMDDSTYVVLTQWESEQAFTDWQHSSAYSKAHKKRDSEEGLQQQEDIVKEKPYHAVYEVAASYSN